MQNIETNQKLKSLRTSRGFTQKQLADAVSVNIRLYQKYESGETPLANASYDRVLAIAKILGVTPQDIV